jgi:AraC-like DNA-binding protein
MDPLSDVVSLLRVQSALSSRLEAHGNWALSFPASHRISFGAILEGSAWLVLGEDAHPLKLVEGDCYLLTAGLPWRLASNPKLDPIDGPQVMETSRNVNGIVHYGTGKKNLVWSSGRFDLDDDSGDVLLNFLPPLIHLPAGSMRTGPLRSAFDLIRFETEAIHPGGGAVASSLATIILVHILRVYLTGDLQPKGWLRAIADQRVGAALGLMHGDFARHWKVEELAAAVGMSRAAFAERFKSLVGLPPLDYLTRWRMAVARKALRSDQSLSAIAESVGYASDSAFNTAFKRATGHSPGWYRTKDDIAPPNGSDDVMDRRPRVTAVARKTIA